MLATRLVHLIESHADALSQSLLLRLENDPRCSDLQKVAHHELRIRTYEIYRNLGDWILGKTELEIEEAYQRLGMRRAAQGVAFSHFLRALLITKEHLWRFLEEEGMVAKPVELFGEMELFRMIDEFYDHAMYYATLGYERVHAGKIAEVA